MKALAPMGRLLFSALFISSGLGHFTRFDGTVQYAQAAGVPLPALSVALSGAMLVIGGVSVLLGAFTRVGALLLTLFLLASAVLVHHYWTLPADEAMTQMPNFWKNIALAGSSLLLLYFGPGPVSVDEALRRRNRGVGGMAERGGYRSGGRLEPRPQH